MPEQPESEERRITAQLAALTTDNDEATIEQTEANQFEQVRIVLADLDWDTIWPAAPDNERRIQLDEALGDDLDQLIARFLNELADPAGELPYSTADGGYQWLVHEWDTEDAVHEAFGESLDEPTRDRLVPPSSGCLRRGRRFSNSPPSTSRRHHRE